jgi:phosphoribosylamine--glycine ligase
VRILVLGSGAREHAILLALKGEGGHELFARPATPASPPTRRSSPASMPTIPAP